MHYAMVLPDGGILSVVEASDLDTLGLNVPEGAEPVPAQPGITPDRFSYDWASGSFVERPQEPQGPLPVRFSFNEWVDRFSLEAQASLVGATMTDPMAKLIYDRAMSAGISGDIDPTDPRTIQGVQYLVGRGYITQADADGALTL